MAGVLEIPIKLGGVLWGNVKQAPPTLLLLAFVTTVISGFVFVGAPASRLLSSKPYAPIPPSHNTRS
jgi:hypothetical protein